MALENNNKNKNTQALNAEKTFGEKTYDFVFNNLINFWANLGISAAFTYWVNHSTKPIWKGASEFGKGNKTQLALKAVQVGGIALGSVMTLDGIFRAESKGEKREAGDRINSVLSGVALAGVSHLTSKSAPFVRRFLSERPSVAQDHLRGIIHDAAFMNVFGEKGSSKARKEVSKVMADGLTLTSAGTFVMIPGVWMAEKMKSKFVRAVDGMHYGAANDTDQSLVDAHARLDAAKKPTFLGYAFGRIGSMAAVQLTGYAIGHDEFNAIKWVGKKTGIKPLQSFQGVDKLSGTIGDALGSAAAASSPALSQKTNAFLSRTGHNWSPAQVEAGEAIGTYNRGLQDFGKYLGLDTLYTAITAATIVPFVGFLKRNVPGMSYRDKQSQPRPENTPATQAVATAYSAPTARETVSRSEAPRTDVPHIRVSDIRGEGRMAHPEQREVTA